MIYEFFTSRNNGANVATFVGQAGRLFYDGANGVIKLSDGATPGGNLIPYNIATTTTIGGIKAGPGANVSIDGTLTIDTAGLPVSFGNLSVVDTTMTTVNTNADLILASNGTGNVELRGNIHFHTTANPASDPFFTANNDGQITILIPVSDPLAGAVKIVGSTSGTFSAPLNSGVMLQLTGNNNDASRLYNDAIGSFAAFVGRRINGTVASPTAVTAGQEIIRFSATGYNGTSIPATAGSRINFAATENYTNSNFGSNIGFWACATGSNVLVKQATIDGQSGLTATKATIQGNLTVANVAPDTNNIYSLGTIDKRWKSTYVGPGGMYIRDTANSTDAVMTVTNGVLYINGIEGLTAGNLYFQDNSILSLLPAEDINIGNVFPAAGNINLNRITNINTDIYTGGNVYVNSGKTINTPRIVYTSGGVRAIQAGIWANLALGVDSLVHMYNPSGDVTVNLNTLTSGAQVTLIISMDTRRAINYGVTAARNSTTGATSIPSTSLLSPQSVQLVYTCIDGTAANTYVAVSRV